MPLFGGQGLMPRIGTTILSFASQAVDVTVGCQNPSEPLHLKTDDLAPDLTFRFKATETGTAYSLVGWSSPLVYMRAVGATSNKINGAAATITSAAGGIITYTLASGDTDTAGDYQIVIRATDPDGKVQTLPRRGYVRLTVHPNFA